MGTEKELEVSKTQSSHDARTDIKASLHTFYPTTTRRHSKNANSTPAHLHPPVPRRVKGQRVVRHQLHVVPQHLKRLVAALLREGFHGSQVHGLRHDVAVSGRLFLGLTSYSVLEGKEIKDKDETKK